MRLNRSILFLLPVVWLSPGIADAQCTTQSPLTVTLSTTANTLYAGQLATLTALVSPCATNRQVRFDFSPTVSGAIIGPVSGPNSGGLSTLTYTAPSPIPTTVKVTVTATSLQDSTKTDTTTITVSVPAIDVGSGAPTSSLENQFINAFFRNGFNNLVSLPPIGGVRRLGTNGYVQEFNDALKTGAKLALATLSPNAPGGDGTTTNLIAQLYADIYAYYTTVGAATAGLPLYDTQNCPAFDGNACTYDFFDKGYALFVYRTALVTGQNFTIRNTFYTEWTARGGMSGPGRPLDVENAFTPAVVTPPRASATYQTFLNGAIYVISSGVNNTKPFTVLSPIYDSYVASGGPAGPLGVPVSQEIVLSTGVHRQSFEGGILEYTPGSGGATQRLPVASVAISGATSGTTVALNLGDTLTLTAMPMSVNGVPLADRSVSWTTSNSKVVSLDASGKSAVLHATGGGVATVQATSEGVLSPRVNVIVTAPCCQVGDGAPSNVQRSFQDALTRNRITPQTPLAAPAVRVGGGYVQVVQSADGGTIYWLAESDRIGSAFVVGGLILEAYDALGGPAGTLGYPITDRSAGGTQRFENSAALAGTPVRLVSSGVLAKWALLGYETGSAGAPTGDATAFSTFGANSGSAQTFASAAIYAATSGSRSGQAYAVSGLILARYSAVGGPGGDYGMPTSDEFVTGGVHQQNFEGGNFTWAAGEAAAAEHAAAKVPGVIVSPASLTAGSRARLAVVGFPAGSIVKVSITGQPDFTVATANGAYSWEMFFPLATRSGNMTITAVEAKSGTTASGTLSIKGFNDNRVAIAKLQGDNQTGPPGALLPLSLRVAVRDAAGHAVSGAAVRFAASSGSLLTGAAVTDASGIAETWLRLPAQEAVTLVNVDSPGIASAPVTFALRSVAVSLANFPKLQQTGSVAIGNGTATIAQKGALLTAVASILRYHQNRSELPGPNGSADPVALNSFLKSYCPADGTGKIRCDGYLSNPDSGEQVVNLWRAAEFTGGADLEIQAPTAAAIADMAADGSPVLVSLELTRNGAAAGGHFVVATGIAADGSIVIQDPSPVFARSILREYVAGFALNGDNWKAELRGVARFTLDNPPATHFLLAAVSQPAPLLDAMALEVTSAAGACGRALDLPDAVDPAAAGGKALGSRLLACDGAQSTYQLRAGAGQPFRALLDDLTAGGVLADLSGSQETSYKVTRPKLNLALAPQDLSFSATGVVGGATFTPGIAPGGVVSIFGSGLAGAGKATAVDLDGIDMHVLFATPFQVNAEIPPGATPGAHVLRVQSAYGSGQQQVAVSTLAPGIFMVGNPPAGAVTNMAYVLAGPLNPLSRGQTAIVWATGLGAVRASGGVSITSATVTAMLGNVELPVQYAGPAPGFPGLYQVNVLIPPGTPPDSGASLALKIGGQLSNSVLLTVQ